jgi:hypothetical protein
MEILSSLFLLDPSLVQSDCQRFEEELKKKEEKNHQPK